MKKYYTILTILGTILLNNISVAQINVDMRPQIKSPETTKFEEYLNLPMNYTTGSPNISIPIYTVEYGGMSLPISLEYDGSGVKVESICSSVGQNWTINVGGVVSRIVKGAPDEGPFFDFPSTQIDIKGYYRDFGLTKLNNELNAYPMYSTYPNRKEVFGRFIEELYEGKKDSQPDLFLFSTPEGSGKFVFNDQRQVTYLENTDFFITEDFIPNHFRTWSVLSPSGINYKFGLDTGIWDGTNNFVERVGLNQPNEFINASHLNTSSWFLSKITNPRNNKVIELEYIQNNYRHVVNNPPSGFYPSCLPLTSPNDCNIPIEIWYSSLAGNPNFFNEAAGISFFSFLSNSLQVENTIKSNVISVIKAGDIKVRFIYSNRNDLKQEYINNDNNAKKLDEIIVEYKENCIKKFIFNYENKTSNEISNNTFITPDVRNRFFLKDITEESCSSSETKKHTFVYNETPLPNKLSYAQDKWGYYNGKINNTSLFGKYRFLQDETFFGDRSVDFNFCKAGSLEKIIYPTGGFVEFNYESHQSSEINDYKINLTPISEINIQPQPQSWGNPSNSITFVYDLPENQALLLTSQLRFPSYQYSVPPSYCQPISGTAVEIRDSNNAIVAVISYAELNHTSPLSSITKTIKRPLDPSLFVQGQTYTLKVFGVIHCYHNNTTLSRHLITPVYDVGGIRIQKIKHKNHNDDLIKEKSFEYFQPKLIENPKKFYTMDYNYHSMYDQYYGILSYETINYLKNDPDTNSAYRLGSYTYIGSGIDPFNLNFRGPHISYGKVIEKEQGASIEYNFYPYQSYFEANSWQQVKFPAKPINQHLMAGEKMSTLVKNTSDFTNKKEANDFYYSKYELPVRGIIVNKLYGRSIFPTTIYNVYGQTKRLRGKSEENSLDDDILEVITNYEYSGNNHNQVTKETSTNSNGDVIEKNYYYPADLLSESLMANLVSQNRKSMPIKIETIINGNKISEFKVQYESNSSTSNYILEKKTFTSKVPESNLIEDVVYELKDSFDLYDSNGNLLQYTSKDGVSTAYIWGYNNTQPVAKLENIAYNLIPSNLISNIQNTTNSATSTELEVISVLNALRQSTNEHLQKAMITTITYKPLIGVSTMTDPKGHTMTYDYDDFNRLEKVTDMEGNILSENQYHYRTQN